MTIILPIIILLAILAIVSLCMIGVGERNSFRSWIAIFIGALLLTGMLAFFSEESGIREFESYSVTLRSFFIVLFGLVSLKYLVELGRVGGLNPQQYSLHIRAYLSIVAFLALIDAMSWGIAVGGAAVMLGYPLMLRFEKQSHSRSIERKTKENEPKED